MTGRAIAGRRARRAGRRLPLLALPSVLGFVLGAAPAGAQPAAALVPLPFPVEQMRGPASEVATGVATSGALEREGPRGERRDPETVVVWAQDGRAAALTLAGGAVKVTPLGDGVVAELARAETPRGAAPGTRRLRAGPLTATLAEATGLPPPEGDLARAGALVIQERRPVPIGGDPKPVPVATTRIEAGPDAAFTGGAPRLALLGGRPALAVVRRAGARGASLVVVAKGADEAWRIAAETPPTGAAEIGLALVALADFAGTGDPQAVLVRGAPREGVLQVWSLAGGPGGAPAPRGEATGYAGAVAGAVPGADPRDLAAPLPAASGPPDLAIPTLERTALAVLSLRSGIRERLRVPLPAPALTGVAVLGRGSEAHVLVGLADGRLADVRVADARPAEARP